MANKTLKFITIIADAGGPGTKQIYIEDVPEGLSINKTLLKPKHARRTQNGTLITTTLDYVKKGFSVSGALYSIDIDDYLLTLYESGLDATLKIEYIDAELHKDDIPEKDAVTVEFNGRVSILSHESDHDLIRNVRSINTQFQEI
jgi:hypothetical protein